MVYRFHDYTLDPAGQELWHGGQRITLEPKVLQVLLYLLEHRNRLVPKAELLEQCWPETFVSESALTRCLARLRKAVPALPPAPPVIETRHRQDYRFVAEVTVLTQMSPPATAVSALPLAGPPLQAGTPAMPQVVPEPPAPPARPTAPGAERRQLTVLFCDVVDSTTLAGQLDPEDCRDVIGRYHAACTAVIQHFGGHVAQYLGDGLLVYFGWPQAYEDDARRAVHTGLALVTAIRDLGHELVQDYGVRLAVRVGMHTGLVVVGGEDAGPPDGHLAMGATPNLAAKIQGLGAPNRVVISAATYQLVQGYFVCAPLGEYVLPGTPAPSALYQVQHASGARGRLDVIPAPQLTPFVGREVELAVLRERLAQVRQGQGQVVLLSGEAGTGKSRLVQVVKTALAEDALASIDCWGSPYAQHTALHPVIEWLQRGVHGDSNTPAPERLARLEALVQQAGLDGHEHLPLLAALVSLDLPEARYPALHLTPQRQRQRTLETLVALLLGLAAQQPVLLLVEDLQWADPTTLEWLGMVLAQGPTTPLFTLLTCRPSFASPWSGQTHLTYLTLPRLTAPQVQQMVQWLGGDRLSAAQVQHIVTQTDGVPLFVEEVTKFVLAAQQRHGYPDRPASGGATPEVAIPATLQYHQHIAQVLEAQFPNVVETQPELLAQHYTEACLAEQAIPYWQRAGQHASERSANLEAVSHFTTGIALLKTLPETPEHTQQALTLYIALGAALQMAKGHAAPEVEQAYSQARALCQHVGETPEVVMVLLGLWWFYHVRAQLHTTRELGETSLRLAQRTDDPALAVIAHSALGATWSFLGALPAARQHLEEGIARYTPDQRRTPVFRTGVDPGVACRAYASATLWLLGYPAQALARVHEALALAHELSHPPSLAFAHCRAAIVLQFCRDVPAMHEQAEAAVALSTERGFPLWVAGGMILRGWALAMQGQGEAGMAQVRQGSAAWRATGAVLHVPYFCTVLADVCDHLAHPEDGLQALAEAYTLVEQHDERYWEAEVCRLRGVLLLGQPGMPQAEAEAWLQRALDVARRQEAKALELRAA